MRIGVLHICYRERLHIAICRVMIAIYGGARKTDGARVSATAINNRTTCMDVAVVSIKPDSSLLYIRAI